MECIIKTKNKQYALSIDPVITETDKHLQCVSVDRLTVCEMLDQVCGTNKQFFSGTFDDIPCIIKRSRGDSLDKVLNEAYWLRQCKHPNVIQMYSITVWHNTVTDCFEGQLVTRAYKDLFDLLYDHNNINEEMIVKMNLPHIFKDVLCGLIYLHSLKIYHKDVKAENVVIDMSVQPYQARLIDLEQASPWPWLDNKFGTLQYNAPEILAKGPISHPSRIDMWSFGLMMWYAYSTVSDPALIQGSNQRQLLIDIRKKTGLLPIKYYKSRQLYEDVEYSAEGSPVVNTVELPDQKALNQVLSVTLQADPARRCEGYVVTMMDFFCDN
ncbi:protein ORF78 [Lake sturgeon herpesvirus]|nr:protein ORF78 [Lake sturgeon herpesvirus]